MKYRFSFYTSTTSSQRGFTLVELLISLTILMVVGSLLLTVFFSALRGASRTKSLIATRQKGNYALSQLTRAIRNASTATCTRSTSLSITSAFDGGQSTYSCTQSNIASVSASQNRTSYLIDNSTDTVVTGCAFRCTTGTTLNLPVVSVSFTLTTPTKSGQTQGDVLPFTATVLLRNAGN